MIVDAHLHLLSWMSTQEPAATRFRARLGEYGLGPDPGSEVAQRLALMDAAGIDQAIVLNNRSDPSLGIWTANADLAAQLAASGGRLVGVAGVTLRPLPDLADMQHAIATLDFRGFKITPVLAHVFPDDFDLMDPVYRTAIELDAPIVWHIGSMGAPGTRRIFGSLDRLSEVVHRYPELKHVIAHLGGHGPPGTEQDTIEYAAARSNVYVDASYAFRAAVLRRLPLSPVPPAQRYAREVLGPPEHWPPAIQQVVEAVSAEHFALVRQAAAMCPERFLFGSDAPEALSQSLAMDLYRRALGGSPELYQRVMGANAAELFKLSEAPAPEGV